MTAAAPPDQCPVDMAGNFQKWDLEPRNLLLGHKVAWHITAAIADQGYSTLADLADLFDDIASVKTQAPRDFAFEDRNNSFSAITSKLHSIRLAHAIQDAKEIRKHRVEQLHSRTSTPESD